MNFMNANLPPKLFKINESITINFYDNGLMLEVTGQDEKENWVVAKIIAPTLSDINPLLHELSVLPKC
jgi:hypothetical protein